MASLLSLFSKKEESGNDVLSSLYEDSYGYKSSETTYRKSNYIYTNNSLDGGDRKKEKDYKNHKASDIFI